MKKIIYSIAAILLSASIFAQNQGISYQAVIIDQKPKEVPGTDIEGNIMPNQSLMVRFTILDAAGTLDYQEEHTTKTDAFGIINLIIGKGLVTAASPVVFTDIDWNGAPKDLKVDISIGDAEVFYTDFSYQELNFVPYAYHKNITATGSVKVDGVTTLKNRLEVVEGSPTFLTGELTVDQKTTLNNPLTVNDTSTLNGPVTVNGDVNGDETSYDSYPLRVQGSNQGIAIKIDGSRSSSTNFITFMDQENTQGSIEGQTTTELLTDPEYIFDNVLFLDGFICSSVDVAKAVVGLVSASTSSTVCVGLGACVTAPTPSLIIGAAAQLVLDIANLALAIAEPVIYNISKHANIGITYQSGAGDYAEWLPKANPTEEFLAGEIIGVKGGFVSRTTDGAEQIMVVSHNPIVLGNMPQIGKESAYTKIAFMGQVPVKVIGPVKPGDYILPSGRNDGMAKAVSPEQMTTMDYLKIAGMAWSGSDLPMNFVNVAVGLQGNDIARLSLQQEKRIQDQQLEIDDLTALIAKMNTVLSQLMPDYAAIMQPNRQINNLMDTIQKASQTSLSGKTIVYHSISNDQLEQGILMAQEILKEKGVDIDNHVFFSKLYSKPDFKNELINEMQGYIKKEQQACYARDLKTGANVIME